MPTGDRGGLKAAFTSFKAGNEAEAEIQLLGRTVEEPNTATEPQPYSYQVATKSQSVQGLDPRPLLQREAVRQLSFRCPVSLAAELRRKAAFNQLEQQEIIVEGLKRVLGELSAPPPGWES